MMDEIKVPPTPPQSVEDQLRAALYAVSAYHFPTKIIDSVGRVGYLISESAYERLVAEGTQETGDAAA